MFLRSIPSTALFVACGSFLCTPSFAGPAPVHGGQYRGPGDTVPPGSPNGVGTAFPGGGANGPVAPGPTTGAPGLPGASPPGLGLGIRPRGRTGEPALGPDLTQWTFWWEFNKNPYLRLKDRIYGHRARTGEEGYWLGSGAHADARDIRRPSDDQLHDTVLVALEKALVELDDDDVTTACMIAMAKIGDAPAEDGTSRFVPLFLERLRSPSQEVAETAAIALGILSHESAIEPLCALMADDARGRELVGASEVPYRTRAFAAYALGRAGWGAAEPVKRDIVARLGAVLAAEDTGTHDLAAACLISLGLVALDTFEDPGPMGHADAGKKASARPINPLDSRAEQIDLLLSYLRNDRNRPLLRAHAPIGLARLARDLAPERQALLKERLTEAFADVLEQGDRNEVVQSCVLGLGLLGDLDSDPGDARIRALLQDVPRSSSDQQARRFALIGMARTARRSSGGHTDPLAGVTVQARTFLKALGKRSGPTTLRPWAGLAAGVWAHALREANVVTPSTLAVEEALREALARAKNPAQVGALAIGAGLAGDPEAVALLQDKLQHISDDEARGYVAVGLGLLGDRSSIEPIREVLLDSKYRPELLRQAAIALGLLGDEELVSGLIEMLREAKGLASNAAIASALGFIGDARSIDPLVALLQDENAAGITRAFAAAALGIVGDRDDLPWNTGIAVDLNYRASTPTLNDPSGTGVLNIL